MHEISLFNLSLAFIPVLPVMVILYRWQLQVKNATYAIARMLVQLLLIGYLLTYIFEANNSLIVLVVLTVMIVFSSWIALNAIERERWLLFRYALLSIFISGGISLVIISQGVLGIDPWYDPAVLIPLAGMVYANSMNCVSLAAERMQSEIELGHDFIKARSAAFNTSLIPTVNSLFAVGLVSLPGMMTGQILSGVSPLIAARYQIVVMCMVFGAGGLASAMFLSTARSVYERMRET